MKEIEYRVEHRYDYWAIDLYIDGKMKKAIKIGMGKEEAELLAGELDEACQIGYDYLAKKINEDRL